MAVTLNFASYCQQRRYRNEYPFPSHSPPPEINPTTRKALTTHKLQRQLRRRRLPWLQPPRQHLQFVSVGVLGISRGPGIALWLPSALMGRVRGRSECRVWPFILCAVTSGFSQAVEALTVAPLRTWACGQLVQVSDVVLVLDEAHNRK